ncbi:MAG TPA: cyclic nucleotide-binding domain-containing protein [Spirochaetota bacterium]|nr:cyclic nucleotide-binding domain-containing protein [Spirochaetota bacterium]HPV41962.1 cyclic nucleotide-binding domain-containing protein [Spirochaetota bacterium]
MNVTGNILANIPIFRHCLDDEIEQLRLIGKPVSVDQGHQFDMKKINSFYVVLNGIFEIESMGKTDVVYLAPGSFFGTIPFTENRQTGRVRALVDSSLMIFSVEDLYRFFLMSYKCLRGYLKTIGRMGFGVSEIGKKYFSGSSRVITVYSPFPQSGRSFLAALLGASLRKSGRTVVLDMSFAGSSIFNLFEKKATAPLSHRTEDSPAFEKIINERMEHVDDGLDLLNVTFGSKVRANPDILSPLLFMLSKEYRYIVIDCGDDDAGLRDRVFGLSDRIFTVVKNRKDVRHLYDLYDGSVREGQRVYYVINEQYAGDVKDFTGGLVLPRFEAPGESGEYARLAACAESDALSPIVSQITAKRRALVLETGLLNSLFYGGFLSALIKTGRTYDLMYTSAYGYIVLSLFLLSGGKNEFRKRIEQFFSEDRLNKLLDITFPTDCVFKNNAVSKLAGEICGDSRIETFHQLPVVMTGQDGTDDRRIFSTGYLRDAVAASFSLYPIFEQTEIAGRRYNSGFPDYRVRVEDLFRVDVDEVAYVSVDNASAPGYRDGKLISFFARYLAGVEKRSPGDRVSDLSDASYAIEVSERDIRIDRILDSSQEISEKLLKRSGR